MSRIPTEQVARQMSQTLVERGHNASQEWLAAWCKRWGTQVAKDTRYNPLFQHPREKDPDVGEFVKVGMDAVPVDLYRLWRHYQDGSRTIRGLPDGTVFWED